MKQDAIDIEARLALSHALVDRGWGLLAARSAWSGVATRTPGIVLVAGVDINSPLLDKAGLGERWPGLLGQATCPFCLGTTRIDDVKYCDECINGMVYRSAWTSHPAPWPQFGPNPARKAWHVEREGRLIGAGNGLRPIGRIVTPAIRSMRAHQLVDRIEHVGGLCECPACAGAGTLGVSVCRACMGARRVFQVQA